MSMQEITLPEVKAHAQTARFFRDGNKNKIEISFVGSKDTLNQTVTPAHMAQFKAEWDAFCDGREPEQRPGTPLTELPSITEGRAKEYIHRNVHNLEELAALDDGQCQMLGHGTLTDRKGARALVANRVMKKRDDLERELQKKTAAIGPVPAEAYAGASDVEALKADMAELKAMLAAALAPKKGGRPKKEKTVTDIVTTTLRGNSGAVSDNISDHNDVVRQFNKAKK
jgi:hypothetical protein